MRGGREQESISVGGRVDVGVDGGGAARNRIHRRRSRFDGTLISSVLNVLSCMCFQEIVKAELGLKYRKLRAPGRSPEKPVTSLKESPILGVPQMDITCPLAGSNPQMPQCGNGAHG